MQIRVEVGIVSLVHKWGLESRRMAACTHHATHFRLSRGGVESSNRTGWDS